MIRTRRATQLSHRSMRFAVKETLRELEGVREDTVNPYDISCDEEGNLQMPPTVKEIIWSPPFPEMPKDEWRDYVIKMDVEDLWRLLFQ